MANILIVDDSAVARAAVTKILGSIATVREAANGLEALKCIENESFNLVITDIVMPSLDGIKLVEQIKQRHPQVPVIVITAHGSEDAAARALNAGAAGYLPKRRLHDELRLVVRRLFDISRGTETQRLLSRLQRSACAFLLDNDQSYLPSLIGYLRNSMSQIGLADDADLTRICVALDEALNNALFHGNLEVSSDLREVGDGNRYYELAAERRNLAPYKDRRIFVKALLSPEEARFTIRDEGPGFDLKKLPDPGDTSNLERLSGRGVMLMMMFMDEVNFNDKGNEVEMVKRKT